MVGQFLGFLSFLGVRLSAHLSQDACERKPTGGIGSLDLRCHPQKTRRSPAGATILTAIVTLSVIGMGTAGEGSKAATTRAEVAGILVIIAGTIILRLVITLITQSPF